MGHQVNIRCELHQHACVVKPNVKITNKCLMLDPKPGDFTIVRIIKVRTGDCSKNLGRTVVGVVKDNTD